ncbi:hypothetical protein IEQ34_007214 [Dendrobium chrysotoxum]|uniref:Pentatricopeptide repeat-containing protein n=1 Tax=Dendrobium chrysotoxum TaxID=161865 RepID=A0AAV7H8W2_DENCH|nr:hypothetical protein IEQ34_007214 [Dendrobium chrysotoxum]
MVSSKTPAIKWTAPPAPSHVLQLIRSERDIQKALLIFESASNEYSSGYRHDHSTFALMATRLAASGLHRPAESLLSRAFSELGDPPAEPSFLPLIRAYSRAHLPLDALRLFRRMTSDFLLRPSHRSYNAVLAALVANNHLSLAKTLFNEMKVSGVPFTVSSFNILIKALCSSGVIEAAFRIFHRMADRGCPPDACTYSTLIDGLCQHGRLDDACKLFDEMPQQGLSPTVVTFTSLMHGLCRSGQFEHALKVFDEMSKKGIKPNVVTYSSLIDGLCKGGRAMEAMELLEQMRKQGCLPNVVTYAALINGLCGEEKLREALEVFDKMRLHGRKPDAGLFGKIIKSLCVSNRYQEAANYLDEMVLSGIVPNRLTWSLHVRIHNMVIRGLCSSGEIIRAFQVYLSSRNRGISVEPETYSLLLEFYCKKGDVHKASSIVDEMMIDGCIPDYTSWCSILDVLWAPRKVRKEAELMWDKLVCGVGDHGVSEALRRRTCSAAASNLERCDALSSIAVTEPEIMPSSFAVQTSIPCNLRKRWAPTLADNRV